MPPSAPPDGADLLTNVQPSDVEFLEQLKEDKDGSAAVFKVKISQLVCAMEVFKGRDNPSFDPDMEARLFKRESGAYRLLKERGFCKRGVVPDFYGTIESIDASLWPGLREYRNHRLPPDAVLIEYIPNMKRIGLENFSEDNIQRFSQILQEFHDMGLIHGDTFPRNMMVVQQQPRDRVVWIDFDCAQVVERGKCRIWTEQKFDEERELMNEFAEFLTQDAKAGKIAMSWNYYYD